MVPILVDIVDRQLTAGLSFDLQKGKPVDPAALLTALLADPLFLIAVEPKKTTPILFRSFDQQTNFEPEVVPAIFDRGATIRADVGVIVLLSHSRDYLGGEILIDTGWGPEAIREDAGTVIVFPAWASRQHKALVEGVCWTAEFWVQSLVPEERRREVLYDVGYSASVLGMLAADRSREVQALRKCHEDLLRLWAET